MNKSTNFFASMQGITNALCMAQCCCVGSMLVRMGQWLTEYGSAQTLKQLV